MRISDWSSDVCSSDLVVEGELPLHQLLGCDLGLGPLVDRLGLLDEGEDVAHAQDPSGEAVGVEQVEVVELLAGGGEGDGLDRKSVVSGKSVSVRVDLGGRRIIKKKKKTTT